MKVFLQYLLGTLLILNVPALPQLQEPLTWNTLLKAENIFPVQHEVAVSLQSSLKTNVLDDASVVEELTTLLSKENVLQEIYTKYLETMVETEKSQWATPARKEIFRKNLLQIASHNLEEKAGKVTWLRGITGYNHLTQEEFRQAYLSRTNIRSRILDLASTVDSSEDLDVEQDPPSSLNWNDTGMVSPVKYQGSCGDCFAFSAVAMLESSYKMKHGGDFLDLSEEDCRDCSGRGCDGGSQDVCLQYAKNQGGLASEADYPYNNDGGTYPCTSSQLQRYASISSYQVYLPDDENGNETAIVIATAQYGPVGVGLNADNWPNNYKGGDVFNGCTNGPQMQDHSVTIVGYTPDVFIIKNSWGAGWGNYGYINLPRGVNACGLAGPVFYIDGMN